MYGIPVFEIATPTGVMTDGFPMGTDGRIEIVIPADSSILKNEQVYCEFFSMNAIDNPPPFSGIQASLRWGAVKFRTNNLDVVIFAPDEQAT